MIKMDQYEHIRRAHNVYGKSIRDISRTYNHSRKTIRKALKGIEPKYRRKADIHYPVMGPYQTLINDWLMGDQTVRKKQRHTAHRIFTRLVEEYDFKGSESTVRAYVRKRKQELGFLTPEAIIPLEAKPDSGAEVDWSEADILLKGVKTRVKVFCMRSKFSGKLFARVYPNERQEMFFDGHIEAFHYFGGVFKSLTYDNLRTAVQKVLKGRKRVENASFHSFRSYYCFESVFCNPGKGNEKGGVECLIGYVRRNFLVPLPEVQSLDELNEILLERCQNHSGKRKNAQSEVLIEDLFEIEKANLISLPKQPYNNIRIQRATVTKQQTVQVDRNHYSVPIDYIRMKIDVHVGCFEVRMYSGSKEIARHSRLFGRSEYQFDPLHYLGSLERKPRALDQALPLKEWREAWPSHYDGMLKVLRQKHNHQQGSQEFIRILQLHVDYPEPLVSGAIKVCLDRGCPGYESVKLMMDRDLERKPSYAPEVQIIGLPKINKPRPTLALYDSLKSEEVSS